MKVLLVFLLSLALLLEAAAGGGDNDGRRRVRKKKYKGQPNIVIFLVDDVSGYVNRLVVSD